MPPAGVKKGSKRARQYEHIKDSLKEQGALRGQGGGDRRAYGQQGARAPRRVEDGVEDLDRGRLSSGERGGRRSGTQRAKGRTRDQLYAEASTRTSRAARRMNKEQLQRAVDR